MALDDTAWSSRTHSSKSRLRNATTEDLKLLYGAHWISNLSPSSTLSVEDGVDECFGPALPFPSADMVRKKDSVMADYFCVCSKLKSDPLRPTAEVITKLLLFIESTNTWGAYSIKY